MHGVKIVGPLGSQLQAYDRTQPPDAKINAGKVDETFVDAMKIREQVFVVEQKVPLENELDEDDARCIHLVIYSDDIPAGTLRILPLPNDLHLHFDKHRTMDGEPYHGDVKSSVYNGSEQFIKIGRLAVVSEFRGRGIANALLDAAFDYATTHFAAIEAAALSRQWNGLVLIHAQRQVEKFWTRAGFQLDAGFGIWDEEGIDHVAMWKRLQVGDSMNGVEDT